MMRLLHHFHWYCDTFLKAVNVGTGKVGIFIRFVSLSLLLWIW